MRFMFKRSLALCAGTGAILVGLSGQAFADGRVDVRPQPARAGERVGISVTCDGERATLSSTAFDARPVVRLTKLRPRQATGATSAFVRSDLRTGSYPVKARCFYQDKPSDIVYGTVRVQGRPGTPTTPPKPPVPPKPKPPVTPPYVTGVAIAADGLKVRRAPTSHAPSLGTLPAGRKVHLRCRVNGQPVDRNPVWFEVADGPFAHGFVSARYIGLLYKTQPVPCR
ncbi:hypothetical protein ABT160_09880 [Streptomyces sp. NPDC001941]|uniref:SH3 domain-containing protein n=1 Tax=Streptomyces sp. NPDC001941 TaxID=3154659 RepID=UPI00332188D7